MFIRWGLLIFLLFGVGFLRTYLLYRSVIGLPRGVFQGVVERPPEIEGLYQRFPVKVIGVSKTVEITASAWPRLRYGDLLEITPRTDLTAADPRSRSLSFPALKLIARNRGNPVYRRIFLLREKLLSQIGDILPEPLASLLAGIVFGIKHSLGKKLDFAFREAGLVHIVVASGFNVTVVIGYLAKFLPWLGRRLGFILIVIGVLCYSIMAGLDPPILRAAIMGLATLLAVSVGRRKEPLLWLVFTAIIMLLIDPFLYASLSFQMSFLAALALVLFQKRIERLLYFFPRLIREDMATTLAVQIFILPLTWYVFGRVSWGSVLVNGLTLWTIPYIMSLGMVAVSIASFSSTLGWWVALPVRFMLGYLLWIVRIFT